MREVAEFRTDTCQVDHVSDLNQKGFQKSLVTMAASGDSLSII